MKTPPPFRRRTLWAGFLAVLLPLGILLVLQYRWLIELDDASEIAHQASLDNYLAAVASDIEVSYTKRGERLLNLPAWVFTQHHLEKAAFHFKKKGVEGASRLFVVSFVVPKGDHELLYFEPSCASFSPPRWSKETQAVVVATSPWRTLALKGGVVERASLVVDERDPQYRILLNPITDDASRVVGVAGMVLDPEYFRRTVLPEAVRNSMWKFFQGDAALMPVVSVRDGGGQVAFTSDDRFRGGADKEKALTFVFKDWTLGLASRQDSPGVWAQKGFFLNIALSTALAAALLLGVFLALRAASREMKLSQMKSDFVSNVSHELRTPLASIRVFGELLRLGRVESAERVREYGDYIETESRRLTQLINNLLDFSSIESGRKSYRFERTPIEDVVAQTLRTFEVRLRQSGFEISYQGPEKPLPPLWIDPGAVAQSLSNLLDNAVKYSNGSRAIAVRLRRAGDAAVIDVEDHGIGIPRDEQEKIFDRFHRVSTGLVHDVKGSGLGLAIVRHIAEAHGGRVTVESRPGEGSMFHLHLPFDGVACASAAAEPAVGDPAPRPI
jgi:signal transduction histidine kinase